MINFAIKYSNKTMKIERKYLKLAQTNSIIMSILNMTILSILKNNIVGLTAWIILGYGLVVYLSWLPAYYISYKYHWNEVHCCRIDVCICPYWLQAFYL